jgi:RNA polymerase sigma-70 factor (ECF subfamily)
LGGPSSELPKGQPENDLPWLQPYPDFELEGIVESAAGPERRYEMRQAVQLAFMAAIQQLPPRQRATLILADVVGWSAAEIASLLGGSTASVNSALQRARDTMRSSYGRQTSGAERSEDAEQRALLDRYVRAWESTDLDAFVGLLKEDAVYSMPPRRQWYSGRDTIGWFFGTVWQTYSGFHLLPVHANAQPAFAVYSRVRETGGWAAHSLQVLTLKDTRISSIAMFMKPLSTEIYPAFRLPLSL